jgi:hypothetical protein
MRTQRLVYTQYGVVKADDPVQLNEQLNLALLAGAPMAYTLRAVIVHLGGAREVCDTLAHGLERVGGWVGGWVGGAWLAW